MSHIFNCYNIAWLWPFPVFWLRIKDYPPDFIIFELSVLWFLSRTKLKVHLLTYNMYVSMSHNISTNNLFYWRLLICHFVTFFSHTAVWQGFFTFINFIKWHLFCFIFSDPALLADQRVLENVLRGCQGVHCILDYFSLAIQKEIKPHMRKIVTDWMLEVTEEEKCR